MLVCFMLLCEASAQVSIEYAVINPVFDASTIIAIVNSQQITAVEPEEWSCFALVDQRDFSGNGINEALVAHILACGGNALGNEFFFVWWDGQTFQRTENFGYSWREPVITLQDGRWVVSTVSVNAGYNTDDEEIIHQDHVFMDGQAVLLREAVQEELEALIELRANEFSYDISLHEDKDLYFHLDNDGLLDIIRCRLWERWGTLLCEVSLDDGQSFIAFNFGCKRIGVLPTQTNGVHDLVCGSAEVLNWDGEGYRAIDATD